MIISNTRKTFSNENSKKIKEDDIAKASPKLTGPSDWVEGTIIDVEKNPFKGIVIAIRDELGRIFFGEEKYFKVLKNN